MTFPPQLGVVGLRAGASFPPEKFGLVSNPEGLLRALSGLPPRPSAGNKRGKRGTGTGKARPVCNLCKFDSCILRRLVLGCQDVSRGLIDDSVYQLGNNMAPVRETADALRCLGRARLDLVTREGRSYCRSSRNRHVATTISNVIEKPAKIEVS